MQTGDLLLARFSEDNGETMKNLGGLYLAGLPCISYSRLQERCSNSRRDSRVAAVSLRAGKSETRPYLGEKMLNY